MCVISRKHRINHVDIPPPRALKNSKFLRLRCSPNFQISILISTFFSADDDDFLSRSAPDANAYEFQSGGIVDLLKKLETDFKTQLSDAQTAESNSRHAFEMVSLSCCNLECWLWVRYWPRVSNRSWIL